MPVWQRLFPTAGRLNIAIQVFSLIAMYLRNSAILINSFFEGYDQGVMGGDLGCIFGCFIGGWIADRWGRINGVFGGAFFALIGGALQSASQSSNFIIVARVVAGLGTGALTGIVPVYCSELAFGLGFIDHGLSPIKWRFILAFQCIPAILLLVGIKLLPDSPRYLASVGRQDEARLVLEHLRGGPSAEVEAELVGMAEEAQYNKEKKGASVVEFAKILAGRGSTDLHHHLGRRAWLCIWLQIMGSWSGTTAVTAYAPVLLGRAGYGTITQSGLAGGLNTIGIFGTILSAFVVDRFGRRRCLMTGSLGLAIVNLIAAALYEAAIHRPELSTHVAPAAVAMLFLFNLIYAATWGTIAFLIPTEIFPSEMRSQGNGYGITGWAIGVGWTTLLNPIMFGAISSRTYFVFTGTNLLWIPIVWFLYPETSGRSLESLTHLFDGGPFVWQMEKAFRAGGEEGEASFRSEKSKPTIRNLENAEGEP
ncbi:SPOSA6832_00701 [Sporobolomyces salmonicolor]|uniref:SPOSA6832_00701-mRNA-1:cds n=1 Tax=Sporidiobolus salmonicolor TaxID=5005 RepID=A0A0D6EGR0_SPOSA|nr:SPOSA6832_00701 [Sporobolomyces salmonicolor]